MILTCPVSKAGILTRKNPEAYRILISHYEPVHYRPVRSKVWDTWIPEAAPQLEVWTYWKEGFFSNEEFEKSYVRMMQGQSDVLQRILDLEKKHRVIILLGINDDEDLCHRGILKDLLERLREG